MCRENAGKFEIEFVFTLINQILSDVQKIFINIQLITSCYTVLCELI